MNKKLQLLLVALLFNVILFAQPTFEWRLENGQLTSPTTYQFDVYLYNTSTIAFELKNGTVTFWVNPTWRNGGTITPTSVSTELNTVNAAMTTSLPVYVNGTTGADKLKHLHKNF